jgi:hypothetical protein
MTYRSAAEGGGARQPTFSQVFVISAIFFSSTT